jgi:drug/metabolite transporter (DMT)-like permease
MSLSSFLIRIILLVIPGIIGSLLYRRVRGRASRKDWEDYLEILVFSFLSYLCYAVAVYALSKKYGQDTFAAFRALTNESIPIDAPIGHAIIISSLISVPVAFVASYIDEYKLINNSGASA